MPEFITYKRWALRNGHSDAELVALVQDEIIPHYRQLPGCKRLGLLRIPGTRSYLATQHWQDREAYEQALASAGYPDWLAAYAPALAQWDKLMVLEAEWETEQIL